MAKINMMKALDKSNEYIKKVQVLLDEAPQAGQSGWERGQVEHYLEIAKIKAIQALAESIGK